MIKNFLFDDEGEPRFRTRGRKYRRGHRGRWWYWPGNEIHAEIVIGKIGLGIMITFDDRDDYQAQLMIDIPFLTLFLSIRNINWLIRLLGLEWKAKVSQWGDCRRELGFRIIDKGLFVYPWIDSDAGDRWFSFYPLDFIFGREKYSEHSHRKYAVAIDMPEGSYPAEIELYVAERKRRRWPRSHVVRRADVDVKGGIPIPDDDAIFSLTTAVDSLPEAKLAMRTAVMWHRWKEGGSDWQIPAAGEVA